MQPLDLTWHSNLIGCYLLGSKITVRLSNHVKNTLYCLNVISKKVSNNSQINQISKKRTFIIDF